MEGKNFQQSPSRRAVLNSVASSGVAIGIIGMVTASETNSQQFIREESSTECGQWEYNDPFCPTKMEFREDSEVNTVDACWDEGNCQYDGWYTRECCYESPLVDMDSMTRSEFLAGNRYEVNVGTLLAWNYGWYPIEGQSPHWAVDFIIHSGVSMVHEDTGDPGTWLTEYSTTASIGPEPADLYTYTNIYDEEDWVGATEDLTQYQNYDVSNVAGRTAEYILGWVPFLGAGVDTGEYLGSMHNMLTNDPGHGTSINFNYDLNIGGEFSTWARVSLQQMDPGQTVTVNVTEGGLEGNWGTNTSLTVQAPNNNPEDYISMTESQLNNKGLQRVEFGEIRKNPSKYPIAPQDHHSDDTATYIRI
ncbi:hypothetical protein [Halovivax gelatinilyticus]|uniref:hypothetical protein n=1 Tax=Halovivax gelatinilyticus TaxID=2961597 RepID=UPI0020CA33E6|nr:hypothetical protein [Halovivax gelatinilyticus]